MHCIYRPRRGHRTLLEGCLKLSKRTVTRIFNIFGLDVSGMKFFYFLTRRNISSDKAVQVIYPDFSKMSQPIKSFSVCSTRKKEFQFTTSIKKAGILFYHQGSDLLTGY